MERQLPLLDEIEVAPTLAARHSSGSVGWRLDARSRATGRRGLAQARRALEEAAGRADRRSAA